jgi:hypothetical protein
MAFDDSADFFPQLGYDGAERFSGEGVNIQGTLSNTQFCLRFLNLVGKAVIPDNGGLQTIELGGHSLAELSFSRTGWRRRFGSGRRFTDRTG